MQKRKHQQKFREDWNNLLYFLSYYAEDGTDCTLIKYHNEEPYPLNRKTLSVRKRVLHAFDLDHTAQRKKLQRMSEEGLLNCSWQRKAPYLLHKNLCLLSLRCRHAASSDAHTTGYIVFEQIEKVVPCGHTAAYLYFKDGSKLLIYQSCESIEKQYQDVQIAKEIILHLNLCKGEES